jgi:hypothetical protein
MTGDFQASVLRITSGDPNNSRFGTGFVIHQDERYSYLLTCAHVVDDVGGPGQVLVGETTASVIAAGAADGLDLAVLRVEGLSDKPSLRLIASGKKGRSFTTAGFQVLTKQYLIRRLEGALGEQVGLEFRDQAERIEAWDLTIIDDYQLQPGYSGSPVVDQASGDVLAVVSHRHGEGKRGLAISVEALEKIWSDMPAALKADLERPGPPTRPASPPPPITVTPSPIQPIPQPRPDRGLPRVLLIGGVGAVVFILLAVLLGPLGGLLNGDRARPIAPGLVIDATPTPVVTLTPTAQPTDTPGVPWLGDITFAHRFDAYTFEIIDPAISFPAGTTEVHAIFEFGGISRDAVWKRIWYVDGNEAARKEEPWNEEPDGIFDLPLQNEGQPLPAGNWRLELYVNDGLLSAGNFSIE